MRPSQKVMLNAQHLKYLEGNIFNKHIGDFLYIHKEDNPAWYCFCNKKGSCVVYGGSSGYTDVIVQIRQEEIDVLKPRLMLYLQELVGRHCQTLHGHGIHQFHSVTITLPFGKVSDPNYEIKIHTGSGCSYDQDEIAYEVMSALSGIPVYKALSPMFFCHEFVRQDALDDGGWISYLFEEQGIQVKYNHLNDLTRVVVSKFNHLPRSDWKLFEKTMYQSFRDWLKAFSKDPFIARRGFRRYGYEKDSLSGQQNSIEIDIESGPSLTFAFQIPYFSYIDFGRIAFAEDIMRTLSETFPAKE